ncbi:MAG: formyltetrahydrofolate deformylase [Mycetocola sp.]
MPNSFILTLNCPDRPGIIHGLTRFLLERRCDITELQQFDDPRSGQLFLRVCFRSDSPAVGVDMLRWEFAEVAQQFGMTWAVHDAERLDRVLVMVSKADHCLNDLLYRWRTGTLGAQLVAVVSNHIDLQAMTEAAGLPFHHVPVTAATKSQAEDGLRTLIAEYDVDTVVLARYMQILSDELAKELDGKAINIHHSFLPSFMGAKPYHQAFDRGVKLVGATAHYITGDLDEGPIIEQVVAAIDHRQGVEDLVRVGRDSECTALARAVMWHSEHRILLNGNRTVIFK